MTTDIKAALDLFSQKQPFKLKSLIKDLSLSESDHKMLTKFLIGKNWIQKFQEGQDPFGIAYDYELTEEGEQLHENIEFFQALDKILKYLLSSGSSDLMSSIIRHAKVPDRKTDNENALHKQSEALESSASVKEGKFYSISDRGKEILQQGGFSALNDEDIDEMFAEFERNRIPMPRTESDKIEDLHGNMLQYLKKQDEVYPHEWVDLLAYYSAIKQNIVRDVARELQKRHGWIEIKPVGVTGITVYGQGEIISSASLPNPLNAKITYAGKLHLQSLQPPSMNPPPISITGDKVNFVNGPGTIQDSSVDNSTKGTKTEIKSESTSKDKPDWLKLIAGIVTLIAAFYGLAKVFGWLQ